jgi:hypothetical protein
MKFSLKATLPPPKMAFLKNFLAENAIFQKIFGTSRDYHKSAVNFSKKILPQDFWPGSCMSATRFQMPGNRASKRYL